MDAERFWKKVRKSNSCWEWTGSLDRPGGYGYFRGTPQTGKRKPFKAHRFSWLLHYGEIPDGMWVLHKCDNPPCVNPEHLFIGTRSDNMRDAAKKGRLSPVGYSRKTHCAQGHKYTNESTYITKEGHRQCRICRRAYNRNSHYRNRDRFLADMRERRLRKKKAADPTEDNQR